MLYIMALKKIPHAHKTDDADIHAALVHFILILTPLLSITKEEREKIITTFSTLIVVTSTSLGISICI